MTNPRNRNQVLGRDYATQPARLPGLAKPATGNPALDAWAAKVTERLEVREGSRGNPFEKAVTIRDMQELGLLTPGPGPKVNFEQIKSTAAWRSISDRLDGIENLKDLPAQVRAILKKDILEEAKKRGAEIRHLEDRIQTASESLAYTVRELTSALAGSAAGVRRVEFASSTATKAIAGIVETVSTTVDGHTATITTQTLSINGLEAQYTVKVNIDGFISGFGLASTAVDDVPLSEFWVQADKFAIQTNGYTGQYPFVVQNVNGVPQLSVASAMIADASIGNLQIGEHISSDNFNGTFDVNGDIATNGSTGWAIDKLGNAVFNDVVVRGDVQATSLNGVTINTTDLASGASSSCYGATNTVGGATCATGTAVIPSGSPACSVLFDPGFSYISGSGKDDPGGMTLNTGYWTVATAAAPGTILATFYNKGYVFIGPIPDSYIFTGHRTIAGADTTSMYLSVVVHKR